MSPALIAVLVCCAGGIGAALRLVLDGLIRARIEVGYPIATTMINLSGSLVLGLVTGLVAHQLLPHSYQLIAGTGLLGGYTTFSTASFETARLLEERRLVAAVSNGLGTVVVGTGAAGLGLAVAALFAT